MNIPDGLTDETRYLGEMPPRQRLPAISQEDIHRTLIQAMQGPPLVQPGESVCLVVSDQTRKTSIDRVLPALLDILEGSGCSTDDISVLVATGIHRPPTPAETHHILGPEVYHVLEKRVFAHDADDDSQLVCVGQTRRGHSVRVNRRLVEADRLILLGAASYHYHAGFGGGRKALVPGSAARDTIAHNHSLTLDPGHDRIHPMVAPGVLDGNPVAEEMLESARLCGPDLIVNTVLDPFHRLVGVFAGDLDLAHRKACRQVEEVCGADLPEAADLVIASAEEAPNWIQSHKALYNAHRAVRPNGRIVLLAPCREGLGNARFRHWLTRNSVETIYRELRQSAEVNGQTALSTRIRGEQAILVTDLSESDRRDLGIQTAPTVEAAVLMALDQLGATTAKPTCYLMSHARHLVPFVEPTTATH